VGLPRPPESFPRVFSPPEPPSTARRSAFVGVLTAVLAFGLASLAVFYLGAGFSGRASPGRPFGAASAQPSGQESGQESSAISTTPEQTPSATPTVGSASPSGALFARFPPVCGTPPKATSLRLVPSPRKTTKSSNTTVTICTISSTGGSHLALYIQAELFPPRDGGDPVRDAAGLVSSDWTQAHQDDGQSTTVLLKRYPALGEDAFRWYKIDEIYKGKSVVVGNVEVRSRNAVVRVDYSRDAPARADERATMTRLLDEAVSVARRTIQAFV
jgi:hypothetical protein